jgi:hypothetical protein
LPGLFYAQGTRIDKAFLHIKNALNSIMEFKAVMENDSSESPQPKRAISVYGRDISNHIAAPLRE